MILFRIWNIDRMQMYYPWNGYRLYYLEQDGNIYEERSGTNDGWPYLVRHCIPMLYTRFSDKEGIPVFEGDILKSGKGCIDDEYTVVCSDAFCYLTTPDGKSSYIMDEIQQREMQIVGNIYEQAFDEVKDDANRLAALSRKWEEDGTSRLEHRRAKCLEIAQKIGQKGHEDGS